ncbi:transmembrane protein, putative [Medicago truncatula]|uniref:Transmembrane protein, putative n=1 Tax=Medicago truncatula TaxID=3880 RepID=G7LBS6_MEDTR|nr:transmembrane protein, putative [Medicago truncatula]
MSLIFPSPSSLLPTFFQGSLQFQVGKLILNTDRSSTSPPSPSFREMHLKLLNTDRSSISVVPAPHIFSRNMNNASNLHTMLQHPFSQGISSQRRILSHFSQSSLHEAITTATKKLGYGGKKTKIAVVFAAVIASVCVVLAVRKLQQHDIEDPETNLRHSVFLLRLKNKGFASASLSVQGRMRGYIDIMEKASSILLWMIAALVLYEQCFVLFSIGAIGAIEKIYIMMMFPDAYKVLFETYMLAKEAEYWRENTRQRLEAVDTDITWEVFRIEYLKVYKEIN